MSYMKIHHMPGPTPEAQQAQLAQWDLRSAFYTAFNETQNEESPECKQARAAYDESVVALEAMLGKDVPCYFVDCDLSTMFSDYYKSVNGCRPHGINYSRQQVLEWCERQKTFETED